ncbi:glucose 1-dehydrogenase [Paenibacillus algorifonticola]|uniref:Glucose 1-dehydrogenase n=2 Tax=Paenibacillus algorifonticola TaxID=684063 RepID=A0A1I2A5L2_9BACL|nr:glucose 1-dehydrogenase [Paenibacillus algorifonticola]
MDLAGKVALVTGAGTGIGQGVAIQLAQCGAKVVIHYNRSDAGAKETLAQIKTAGGEAVLAQADVASKAEIERLMKQAAHAFPAADAGGTIDILVNNAALQLNYGLFDHDETSFDRMMNINLKGYWQCMQAAIPYMKNNPAGGRIILISSVHSKRPTDFDAVYAMTKGGIRMLGREAAIELAQYGITVNTIEPGQINVGVQSARESRPIGPAASDSDAANSIRKKRDIRKKFPLGRVGKPLDVARLVCFIASDESEFMTGSAIRLDGGSMLL